MTIRHDPADDSCPVCHADWKRPHADDCPRFISAQSAADTLARVTGSRLVRYSEEVRQGSVWDPASRIVTTVEATSTPDDAETRLERTVVFATIDVENAASAARAAGQLALADRLEDAASLLRTAMPECFMPAGIED